MKRVILTSKMETTGSYRIKWLSGSWWVVGQGTAQDCGGEYNTAKRVLRGLMEPPPWPEPKKTSDPDLDEFGRGLADI